MTDVPESSNLPLPDQRAFYLKKGPGAPLIDVTESVDQERSRLQEVERECDELRAEVEAVRKRDSELWAEAQRKIDTLKQQRRELRAEVERMRPVVDAARVVVDRDSPGYAKGDDERIALDNLLMAFAQYREATR